MAIKAKEKTFPITFDLSQEQYRRLLQIKREYKLRSLSDIVRYALKRFDFKQVPAAAQSHQQVSVRLTQDLKAVLV
ncbi:MAG: hypothetical protein AAGA45_01300, partial [Verrucomicrobiota bacterium]